MTLAQQIRAALPADTVGRYDLLPLFQNPKLFGAIVYQLSAKLYGEVDYIAAPEALGWILGASMAARLHVGFIGLRKAGRLPYGDERLSAVEFTDYSHEPKTLVLVKNNFPVPSRIAVVDEWIQTGAQASAAITLLEGQGADIVGVATIGINRNAVTQPWIDNKYAEYIVCDE